jgi:hypothetical protein
MEQNSKRPEGEGKQQPLHGEDRAPVEVEPIRARKIIDDGIRVAEAAGQQVEDWVARHIALQLKTEDGSGLDVLARTGEITGDLQPELLPANVQALPRRPWIDALYDYALDRQDHRPVDGWAEHAQLRDRFYIEWSAAERGYIAARELDREIRLAQDARQMIGDELAMRLLMQLASGPHSAVARFTADGRVTDDLGRELQERYLSGTEQERRWLNELGSWIAAQGKPSPIPWWRSSAPVESPVAEHDDPGEQEERRAARLADLDERLAPLPDLGDIPRPRWGHAFGDGYEWMEEGLPEGWHAEPIWGRYGWDLGSWPLVVIALYIDDEHGRYAVTEYVEGDLDVKRYKSRGALYVAVNQIAEFHWRLGQSRGPRDLPEGQGLLPHHTGPYTPWRSAREDAADKRRRPQKQGDEPVQQPPDGGDSGT